MILPIIVWGKASIYLFMMSPVITRPAFISFFMCPVVVWVGQAFICYDVTSYSLGSGLHLFLLGGPS